jgi:hypothetical protein
MKVQHVLNGTDIGALAALFDQPAHESPPFQTTSRSGCRSSSWRTGRRSIDTVL